MIQIRTLFVVVAVVAIVAVSGCRSKRMNIPQAPSPAPRGTITEAPVAAPSVIREPEEPVTVREERFTFTQELDRRAHDTNQFFVIMGSFRSAENANRFKQQLEEQGFEPIILVSESGLHRVSVDSFADEAVARIRITRIRSNYPDYNDAWLLIRKR